MLKDPLDLHRNYSLFVELPLQEGRFLQILRFFLKRIKDRESWFAITPVDTKCLKIENLIAILEQGDLEMLNALEKNPFGVELVLDASDFPKLVYSKTLLKRFLAHKDLFKRLFSSYFIPSSFRSPVELHCAFLIADSDFLKNLLVKFWKRHFGDVVWNLLLFLRWPMYTLTYTFELMVIGRALCNVNRGMYVDDCKVDGCGTVYNNYTCPDAQFYFALSEAYSKRGKAMFNLVVSELQRHIKSELAVEEN